MGSGKSKIPVKSAPAPAPTPATATAQAPAPTPATATASAARVSSSSLRSEDDIVKSLPSFADFANEAVKKENFYQYDEDINEFIKNITNEDNDTNFRRKLCRDFNLNKIIKLNSLEEALVISNLIMDADLI